MAIPQESSIISAVENSLDVENPTTYIQEQYITFEASGGLQIGASGKLEQTTKSQFALTHGVDRKTLYNWTKSIPDFWDKVEKRRHEIFTQERVAMVWNGVFMRAAKGDFKQAEMVLTHHTSYVPPAQRVQVDVGDNFVDLISQVQQDRMVIEPETQQAPAVTPELATIHKSPDTTVAPEIEEAEIVEDSALVQPSELISPSISTSENTSNPLLPTSTHNPFPSEPTLFV